MGKMHPVQPVVTLKLKLYSVAKTWSHMNGGMKIFKQIFNQDYGR